MKSTTAALFSLLGAANAAREFLDMPDTGAAEQFGVIHAGGTLPNVSTVVALPDFEYLAGMYMNSTAFTYYHSGAAGEWSYRNNLEVFQRVRLRPRVMVQIDNIEDSLPTTILGYNFSAPFFISPFAQAGYAGPWGEAGVVKGAAAGGILQIVVNFSTLSKADIQKARAEGQILFQQLYITPSNDTKTLEQIRETEANNFQAIVLTVDCAADGNRHRAARKSVGSANSSYTSVTWEKYEWMRNQTKLPIIPKGIQTVEDARLAVEHGCPAIFLSNHGGRQLDGSPSGLEVAIEIHEQAPEIFRQIEVYADGGVRYGADVIKLLALGVKAVGLGRPFAFANIYGQAGIERAIEILKREIAIDAGNAGIGDLKKIGPQYVRWQGFPLWAQGS